MLTAIWSTMVGSLLWVGSLRSTYYAFMGTARQEQVLAADQVVGDFKRSGMTDLRAFVMQDYLGGAEMIGSPPCTRPGVMKARYWPWVRV